MAEKLAENGWLCLVYVMHCLLFVVLQCKPVFQSTATLGKWCVESPPSASSTQAFF